MKKTIIAGMSLAVASLKAEETAPKPPNVLFIAIDDLRDFVGYFKSYPGVKTPNIDRLSEIGVSFVNAYCQSPMCAPSRNSLMTGLRPSTTGCYGFQKRRENPAMNVTTLPEQFRKNGYYTVGTGKLHHGSRPEGHGPDPAEWDEYWPSVEKPRDGSSGTYEQKYHVWGELEWGPTNEGDEAQGDTHHANWAVNRIKQGFPEPFFFGVGFFRPHLPCKVPQKYFDDFSPSSQLTPVPRRADDISDVPEAGQFFARYIHAGFYAYDELVRKFDWYDEALQAYLACIEFTDAQLGKVLDAFENSPYKNNTIIVLWSDNGFQLGEKGAWTKFTLWRDSDRIPLIFAGPGIARNALCSRPVELLDIYPTLVSLCGLPQPPHQLEGRDISPLLKNPRAAWPWPAITTAGENNHAVSTEDWRYIRYFNGDEELYRISTDPNEWNNLAGNPEYQDVKEKLKAQLPVVNAPNQPGTTLSSFYDRGTWNISVMKAGSIKWFNDHNGTTEKPGKFDSTGNLLKGE